MTCIPVREYLLMIKLSLCNYDSLVILLINAKEGFFFSTSLKVFPFQDTQCSGVWSGAEKVVCLWVKTHHLSLCFVCLPISFLMVFHPCFRLVSTLFFRSLLFVLSIYSQI